MYIVSPGDYIFLLRKSIQETVSQRSLCRFRAFHYFGGSLKNKKLCEAFKSQDRTGYITPTVLSAAASATAGVGQKDITASTNPLLSGGITLPFDLTWKGRNLTSPLQWQLSLITKQASWCLTEMTELINMLKLILPEHRTTALSTRTPTLLRYPLYLCGYQSHSHPHSKVWIISPRLQTASLLMLGCKKCCWCNWRGNKD